MANVRFGSKAEVASRFPNVRSYSNIRHSSAPHNWSKSAKNRHMHRSKPLPIFQHLHDSADLPELERLSARFAVASNSRCSANACTFRHLDAHSLSGRLILGKYFE